MTDTSGESRPAQRPAAANPQNDDEIDLGYLLAVFWDHRWWIATITSVVTLIGICYALLATPIYQADALLQIERRDTGTAAIMGQLDLLTGNQEVTSSTQTQILQSRMILGQAAQRVGLDLRVEPKRFPVIGAALVRRGVERPGFIGGGASVWAGESIQVDELSVAQELLGQWLVLRVGSGNRYQVFDPEGRLLGEGMAGETLQTTAPAITLTVSAVNAPEGAEFRIMRRSIEAATRALRANFSVSEQGRDSSVLSVTLSGADSNEVVRALDAINDVYLVQNINRQAAEAENRLAFLEQQRPQVRENLTDAENLLNQYRATQDSVDLDFETRTVLEQIVEIESQLTELEFQETELAQRYTPSHPSYQSLLERRRQLTNERNRLESRVENLPTTQQEVLRMTRDVEVNQQLYMQMLNTMQELRVARAGTVGNVRIIDDAALQPNPIAPRRSLIVIIAFLLGGMLSLFVVMAWRMMNRGVESADQLTAIGLPVYATVPLSETQQSFVQVAQSGLKRLRQLGKGGAPSVRQKPGVLAHNHPTDLSIEALRGLRTSLHFAMLESKGNNCVMVTGSGPSVGKSFISVNLAVVCAQGGQRVLVIDGDMRRGHVHDAFGQKGEGGFSELLAGKLAPRDVIRVTETPGLHYISRGIVPPNPSELLMSRNFSRFMEQVSQHYDLVIIDTPPVLAVTDAAIVGRHVGTTFLVARFQTNSVKEIERALQQLDTAGVTVQGGILNALERSAAASYGYGYGYYGYYSYDQSKG